MRLRRQSEKKNLALAAEYEGAIAGYINLHPSSGNGPLAGRGCPDIVDLGVPEQDRRSGVGTKPMDIAEQTASDYSDTVCLRAGLHSGYGSAQRMYVKRGHLPDGSGAWYCDEICPQYADCRNGGDLFLHVLKASG